MSAKEMSSVSILPLVTAYLLHLLRPVLLLQILYYSLGTKVFLVRILLYLTPPQDLKPVVFVGLLTMGLQVNCRIVLALQ